MYVLVLRCSVACLDVIFVYLSCFYKSHSTSLCIIIHGKHSSKHLWSEWITRLLTASRSSPLCSNHNHYANGNFWGGFHRMLEIWHRYSIIDDVLLASTAVNMWTHHSFIVMTFLRIAVYWISELPELLQLMYRIQPQSNAKPINDHTGCYGDIWLPVCTHFKSTIKTVWIKPRAKHNYSYVHC
jgi:hypothetical protein